MIIIPYLAAFLMGREAKFDSFDSKGRLAKEVNQIKKRHI